MPALPVATPAGLTADSNRWQNITIQATHGFTAAAGSNNVLDNVVEKAGNSAATGEPPTGLVLDLTGTQQGWTVRNGVVLPVVERSAAATDGDGRGRRGDRCKRGFGAWIGIRSVWDAGSYCVQRELHGDGHGEREYQRIDWDGYCDLGRGGLLGNDDGERECGRELGYGGGGEPDRRTEYDVLWREPAEGQRRLHGLECGWVTELWNAVRRRRRNIAGRRELYGAGAK